METAREVTLFRGKKYRLGMEDGQIPVSTFKVTNWEVVSFPNYPRNVWEVRFYIVHEGDDQTTYFHFESSKMPTIVGDSIKIELLFAEGEFLELVGCSHSWADTGFSFTYCKSCDVKGRINMETIEEVA